MIDRYNPENSDDSDMRDVETPTLLDDGEVSSERPELSVRYPHLRQKAAGLVDAPVEERLAYIKQDRLIGYPAADAIIDEITDRINFAKRGMNANLLVMGPPRNGKTTIIKRLNAENPPAMTPSGQLQIPVVRFDMPEYARERDFWLSMLHAMRSTESAKSNATVLRETAYRQLARIDCKLVVIDEFHNIQTASPRNYPGMLALVKNLTNRLNAPLVCAGIEDSISTLAHDDQLAGRFDVMDLPRWKLDATLFNFLAALESTLPFPEPSNLSDPVLARAIYAKSNDGILMRIVDRVQRAAVIAVRRNSPCITLECLQAVDVRSLYEARPIPRPNA